MTTGDLATSVVLGYALGIFLVVKGPMLFAEEVIVTMPSPGTCDAVETDGGALIRCHSVPVPTAIHWLATHSGNVDVGIGNPEECYGTMDLRWLSSTPISEALDWIVFVERRGSTPTRLSVTTDPKDTYVNFVCQPPVAKTLAAGNSVTPPSLPRAKQPPER